MSLVSPTSGNDATALFTSVKALPNFPYNSFWLGIFYNSTSKKYYSTTTGTQLTYIPLPTTPAMVNDRCAIAMGPNWAPSVSSGCNTISSTPMPVICEKFP